MKSEIVASSTTTTPNEGNLVVVSVAILAAFVKIGIALTTLGTNDVIAFYEFGKAIETHGLIWTYQHSPLFNHPPLVGYFLPALTWLARQPFLEQNGITFPFLLRLPGIVADFCVVLMLLSFVRQFSELRPPQWALILFAASPVSIMVSGFHGNTDPVMVLFLVAAALLAVRDQPILSGLFLALSCQIKIVPALLLPLFLLFWLERGRWLSFTLSFLGAAFLFCAEPLLRAPHIFVSNVLSYGGFWGIWGVTYCLRMTGLGDLHKVSFFNLSVVQNAIMASLKILVVAGILVLAWRRRKLPPAALFASIGYAWMIFFVFSPGVAAQYLVWLAPFVLLLSPSFYPALVVGSSVFLLALYTISSGGFPWYFAHASNKLNLISAHWALAPWITLVAGLVALAWRARQTDREFRFLSLSPIKSSNQIA